jgi:Rrf2 family protein
MKLSRTVTYAIQATLQLAETNSKGPVPCSRLAAEGEMPERFLLQILRNLVNQGILQSTRGVDGGYSLVRSPEEISVLDVIEAIEGPLVEEPVLVGSGHAPLHERLEMALLEVSKTAREQLQAIKLSQILHPVHY